MATKTKKRSLPKLPWLTARYAREMAALAKVSEDVIYIDLETGEDISVSGFDREYLILDLADIQTAEDVKYFLGEGEE